MPCFFFTSKEWPCANFVDRRIGAWQEHVCRDTGEPLRSSAIFYRHDRTFRGSRAPLRANAEIKSGWTVYCAGARR